MNEKHYQYVYTVAKEGSFSRAAKKLFISQPSLSQCIQRIEQKYGVALFNRTRNSVCLTSAGEHYLETGKELLSLEQEIAEYLLDVKKLHRGKLIIGATPYRDCVFLAPAIHRFNIRYPNVEIVLQELSQEETEKRISEGQIDIGVTLPPYNSTAFEFEPLFQDHLVLAIAPDHWYFRINDVNIWHVEEPYSTIHLNDMAQCDFILLANRKVLRNIEEEICFAAGFRPNVILETKSIEAAHAMASEGLGATFIPESFLRFSKIRKELAYYRFDVPSQEITLGILKSSKQQMSDAAKEFVEILRSSFKGGDLI